MSQIVSQKLIKNISYTLFLYHVMQAFVFRFSSSVCLCISVSDDTNITRKIFLAMGVCVYVCLCVGLCVF